MEERNVTVLDIAKLVYFLQKIIIRTYKFKNVSNMWKVLRKREVQNAVITGIQLDVLAENDKLEEPLQTIVKTDEGLYGVDEILAFQL